MEAELGDGIVNPHVRATLSLGAETYSVNAKSKGSLSEQLASMKEESMVILKEFITRHNVPNDVPDELVESSSDDDTETPPKSQSQPKKKKLT